MAWVKLKYIRSFLIRAEHGSDLIRFILEFSEKEMITTATFSAIGALKSAKLGFYNQVNHEYKEIMINEPSEIVSCVGNISIKDGKSFIHAHIVLSDENGNTKAGHLFEAIVFASEIHLNEFKGPKLERKIDDVTGLSLWDIEQKN